MIYERLYEELFYNEKEKFNLMKNTASGLLLQFVDPIRYDLTIPSDTGILRLLNIFQDWQKGKIISSEEVNCLYPLYTDKSIAFDFGYDNSKRIEEGFGLCFGLNSKYDSFPLRLHLNWNKNIFGNEGSFYRFREGMRENIEVQVSNYFDVSELKIFKEIGKIIQPYVKNLDKGVPLDY